MANGKQSWAIYADTAPCNQIVWIVGGQKGFSNSLDEILVHRIINK
jgi:hypothetical protein